MTEHKELVDNLRRVMPWDNPTLAANLTTEAACVIEAQAAEIAALREALISHGQTVAGLAIPPGYILRFTLTPEGRMVSHAAQGD